MIYRGTTPLLALATVIALGGLTAGDAAAQQTIEFIVNAPHDAVDAAPGDGVCADAGGACTLRAAVMESNALAGPGSVNFSGANLTLTIAGTGEDAALTGDLDITDSLSIIGSTIDGGGLDRVFDIDPASTGGVQVGFSFLTIRNGSTSAAAGTADDRGGAILNRGTATLQSGNVVDSEADRGGGIFNQGFFQTVGPTEITNNRAVGTPASAGGGIYNEGTLEMRGSVFEGNSSSRGGGIFNTGEAAAHIDTTVAGNTATISGAGIYNEGMFTIGFATISGNTGEGLANAGSDAIPGASGTATLTNSTISGNSSSGVVNGGSLILNSVTVAANGGAGLAGGPIGSMRLKHTLMGTNGAADCTPSPTLTSLGHNLDSDGSCSLSGPGDISNADPRLGPLATNPGVPGFTPTQTHALLAGSPAIDAGDNATCPASDQRHRPRPVDGNGDGNAVCDIGAFEADSVAGMGGPTASPTAAPTPVSPVQLPGTGGDAGSSSSALRLVLAAAAIAAAGGALWRRRRNANRA